MREGKYAVIAMRKESETKFIRKQTSIETYEAVMEILDRHCAYYAGRISLAAKGKQVDIEAAHKAIVLAEVYNEIKQIPAFKLMEGKKS